MNHPHFLVLAQHSSTHEMDVEVFHDMEEAAKDAHAFFKSYRFEVRDGKPYDPGNDPEGFACFDDVETYVLSDGSLCITQFTHCGGDGPVLEVRTAK